MTLVSLLAFFTISPLALSSEPLPVLADIALLQQAGAKILEKEATLGLGMAMASSSLRERISALAHKNGKCGGYELLSQTSAAGSAFRSLRALAEKNSAWELSRKSISLEKRPEIVQALGELSESRLRDATEWLASYPSRSNRLPEPNVHVNEMEAKVRVILQNFSGTWSVEQISHARTRQNNLKVRLEGKSRPNEIIVLGGHLDSISSSWSGSDKAPGADDNASGSANLLEALRVLAGRGSQERSIEIFWYAGEESGLLGSSEIAQQYKSQAKDVVAVLQLDMTMFPGSGELVIGNVTDFTSAWLRDYLAAWNETYLGVRLIPDRCGYACSDHASWHRQGYPALMPFESDTGSMNRKIHTERDTVDSSVSFRHSLIFGKIALLMAMDLGNSTLRQPY